MNTIQCGEGFWNFRASFRVGGVVDIGTHASLVRLANGAFVLLDSIDLSPAQVEEIRLLTDGGSAIEAILNLHPFHTLACERMHQTFPAAVLHGSERHVRLWPDLPWATERIDDTTVHQRYAADLEFSIPLGVDFISSNEAVHFASVLVRHRSLRSLHVDDTLMTLPVPRGIRRLPGAGGIALHPTLALALERRAGATDDFRAWMSQIADRWSDTEHLCAAHSRYLNLASRGSRPFRRQMDEALAAVRPVLALHKLRFG